MPGSAPRLGPSLPDHPVDAVRAGSGAGVNVVLGCTTHEMVAFMGTPELFAADEATVRDDAQMACSATTPTACYDGYRAANPDDSPPSLFLLSRPTSSCASRHVRFAEALLAGAAAKPRMYLFDFRRPSPDGVDRAGHGADMPFFFDNLDKAPASRRPPRRRRSSGAMSGALVALARTGDPNHDAIQRGRPTPPPTGATMVFDVESHVDLDPMGEQRRIWDEHRLGPGRSSAEDI